jgi:uncharacterized protein involved in exopolysaccharide biosynthesis
MTELPPDRDAEQEVDFGRLGSAIVTRWWLLVGGLVAGVVLGYLAAAGGSTAYTARSTLYLGQPLTPNGGGLLQTLATNPSTVREVTHAESTIRRVAAATGMTTTQLRRGITVTAVSGILQKAGQTPLVEISVRGPSPRRTARAADLLADISAQTVSGYVDTKISTLEEQLKQSQGELAAIDAQLADAQKAVANGSASDRLLILTSTALTQQRRSGVVQDIVSDQQLLSLARNVEASHLVTHAAAVKDTAKSARNAMVAGGLIGLLLGLLAALLWEPVAGRVARRPSV